MRGSIFFKVYLKGPDFEHIQYGKLFPSKDPQYGEELIVVRQKNDKFYVRNKK